MDKATDIARRHHVDPAGSDFLDETITFWQPVSDHPLTREDARQMVERVARLFDLLSQAKARREAAAVAWERAA